MFGQQQARRAALALVPLALAGTTSSVGAQTPTQSESFRQSVVVTAAATPVELGSTSRSLIVLTREQIAALPARSVSDLLRLVSSVDVRSRGDRGMQTDFAMRGGTFGQALVLVDGVRLNDTQTGHHNGDIPVPLGSIERIEVLQGGGASLFGADALAGAINIITTRDARPSLTVEGGSFDGAAARAQAGIGPAARRTVVASSFDRSSGFTTERQFVAGAVSTRTALGARGQIGLSHTSKDFGANGFYGAAPSHEWTHQTLLHAAGPVGTVGGWAVQGAASYRTHADRFVFDVRRPALSDNRHRSHTLLGTMRATRTVNRFTLTIGGEGSGDWLRSTNLGDRTLARVSAFAEARVAVHPNVQADLSMRVDRYDQFGASGSPGAGLSWWLTPRLRARGSVSRAFRVPTFTERYYRDPANQARAEVGPETSWGGDGGVDVFVSSGWLVQAGGFARRDRDVIDWLRPTPADLWRTFNVHRVRSNGLELGVRRIWANGAFVHTGYTHVSVSAATASTLCGALNCLSKYVLDYAPDVFTAAALVPLPGGVRVAPRLEYKRRQRNTLTTDYALLDVRVTRAFGRHYELRIEGTNLGNAVYQEIAGVAMPGRAGTAAFTIGAR